MTNDQIEKLYKTNIDVSHIAALRVVYNAGYFAGKGITPTGGDQSKVDPYPTVIPKLTKPD